MECLHAHLHKMSIFMTRNVLWSESVREKERVSDAHELMITIYTSYIQNIGSIWCRNGRIFVSLGFRIRVWRTSWTINWKRNFKPFKKAYFMPTCDNRCAYVDDFLFFRRFCLLTLWFCVCAFASYGIQVPCISLSSFHFILLWERQSCVSAHFKFISFFFWLLLFLLLCYSSFFFILFGQLSVCLKT